jgi:hypothetical protein
MLHLNFFCASSLNFCAVNADYYRIRDFLVTTLVVIRFMRGFLLGHPDLSVWHPDLMLETPISVTFLKLCKVASIYL